MGELGFVSVIGYGAFTLSLALLVEPYCVTSCTGDCPLLGFGRMASFPVLLPL